LFPPALIKSLPEITEVFTRLGFERLAPVFDKLAGRYSYDQLRLCRLALKSFPPAEDKRQT